MMNLYWPWFLLILAVCGIIGFFIASALGAGKVEDLTKRLHHLQELNYQCCMRETKLKSEVSDMRSKLVLAKVKAIEDDCG